MTRDETVALFLECEAKRAAARAAAPAEGKDEDGANAAAHEAAKAHWNAWAEARLAERKAMEADGRWAAEKNVYGNLELRNPETRAWMELAEADFSRCLFLVRGVEGTKETAGEEKKVSEDGGQAVKSLQLEADRADFSGFIFPGDARFASATFRNFTSFGHAKFQKQASFTGIKVERAFNMTGAAFVQVPAFSQADFKQAPDLDDVDFRPPGFWRRGDPKLIPLYRAIRRMAIQGADYEREQMAFKGETRSKRWTEHKPWHTAFWFGIAYDAFSDFGRSIARPLAVWSASWLAFAALYLWNAGARPAEWGAACAGDGASKALKALTLSAANALPLIGSSRSEVAREFYTECLKLPHAPAWSPILQIWQTLWSAVLLFLFLLALRNQFKIK